MGKIYDELDKIYETAFNIRENDHYTFTTKFKVGMVIELKQLTECGDDDLEILFFKMQP